MMIDNDLFQELKSRAIEQFKIQYPQRSFKYKEYPFSFRLLCFFAEFFDLFSLTFDIVFQVIKFIEC